MATQDLPATKPAPGRLLTGGTVALRAFDTWLRERGADWAVHEAVAVALVWLAWDLPLHAAGLVPTIDGWTAWGLVQCVRLAAWLWPVRVAPTEGKK